MPALIYSCTSPRATARLLEELISMHTGQPLERVSKDTANDLRIDAVHSTWLKSPDSNEALVLRPTRSGWAMGLVSQEQARLHADYIGAVADKGLELFELLRPDLFLPDEE